ncbi:MAG: GNAT family N-acetyltransferase [Tannerellaceae bacterium]
MSEGIAELINRHYVRSHPYEVALYIPTPGVKQASHLRDECQHVIDRIVSEEPGYWPYGCNIDDMDGGCYLIRTGHTKQAAGFVGWQDRRRSGKRIGYYAIGVLPEYRGMGFAKEAVSRIIAEKATHCDAVRAYVNTNNTPSRALASSLGVRTELF